jgi:hypothetical protein
MVLYTGLIIRVIYAKGERQNRTQGMPDTRTGKGGGG